MVDFKVVDNGDEPHAGIKKPTAESLLERFRSKTPTELANVETLLEALPVHSIAQAKDFVRLQPQDEWTFELGFVNVPVKGQKRDTLHLIDETVAHANGVDGGRLIRHRLALGSKPHGVFFLCVVPSQNIDNPWVSSNISACDRAVDAWVSVASRRAENKEGYKCTYARDADAFPAVIWPQQSVWQLIEISFAGRMIMDAHVAGQGAEALARLTGRKILSAS